MAEPYSNPTLSNITLIGINDGDNSNTGIRLREGTKGRIYNIQITGFPNYGVRVSDQVTFDNVGNNILYLSNTNVVNNGLNWKDCDFSQISETLNEAWFDYDIEIGAGSNWTDEWVIGL